METAASIIAFVTLTLATVKSCRDLLSAVKDGPEKLDHVNTAISTLVSAFEQIKTEPQLEALLSSTSLRTATAKCKADFERFKARLENVKILPNERRCGRLWKRLKLAFSEKDLPWVLAVVNSHVDAVTMELNIIQFRSLNRVEESTSRILALQETYSMRVDEQSTTLQAVHDHASDAAKHGVDLREAIESLTQKMMAMSSASHEQANTMSEKLFRIEEEITKTKTIPVNKYIGSLVYEPFMHTTAFDPNPGAGEYSALDQSMRRLSDLVTNVECTMESGDAMDIIDDLDTLLRTAAKWNRKVESTSDSHACRQSQPGLEINELRGQFLKAKNVQLNKALTQTIMPEFRVTKQERSYAEYKGSGGVLRIQRRRRILNRDSPQRATFSDETNIATWMPGSLEVPVSITISYYERNVAGEVSSLPPNLIVSPVLDLEHPVFDTVRYGQVDDLRRLLSEKKAWLRARDPYGASLLHYANQNLSVMQFLIANGADVDDLSNARALQGPDGHLISPLYLSVWDDRDNSACFKQLLAAGADPFLPTRHISSGGSYGSAIRSAALLTDYVYMKSAADEIANTCDAFGILAAGPAFLHVSVVNCNVGNMRILMDQGIDINTQIEHGNNCLITLFQFSASRSKSWPLYRGVGVLETAVFLIESGIDLGPDASGMTPGQFAYHLALDPRYSSFIGDSWDCALALCGIDVAESRVGHPRVGRYKDEGRDWVKYNLDMFKEMWDGRESLCPYYEEAIAESAAYATQTIDWSRVCTDEGCPYYDTMRKGPHHRVKTRGGPDDYDSDDSVSSLSTDSSEDGGVIISPRHSSSSEDGELSRTTYNSEQHELD